MKPLSEQEAVTEELQNAYLGINGEGANDYREKACARHLLRFLTYGGMYVCSVNGDGSLS